MPQHEARYKYRLRINAIQARELKDVFDVGRFVWNQALGRWSDLWRHEGLRLSCAGADQELTDWRSRFEWLAAQPSVPQQQVLRDLWKSISAFFDKTNPAGRPRFKKKGSHATARWTKNGFKVAGSGLGLAGDRLEVATASGRLPLRVVWSRPLPSAPTSVTVYRDKAGRFWASFVVRIEVPEPSGVRTGCRTTGLDVGLTTFASTEDPETCVTNPRYARAAANALARSNRNTARKAKGSNHRTQSKRRAARVAGRVADQRLDFAHKAARGLVQSYAVIGVEDLRITNLVRKGKPGNRRTKAGLNRAMADAGWGQFLVTLSWQATKAGTAIVVLPARDTTQTCSDCGTKAKPRIELSDRVFRCRACGLVEDRDRNAARNLNPRHPRNRLGCTGAGDDGTKPKVPAGTSAA
jgi:putative transposase